MQFGGVLKKMRKKAGFSQTELALELGIGQSDVSKLETNRKTPDIYTVTHWANVTRAHEMVFAFMCSVDVGTAAQALLHMLGAFVFIL